MLDGLYSFNLPEELIAQVPAQPRDSARLLVYSLKTGEITDSVFSKVEEFLPEQTTLVLNDSKVESCRWLFDDGRIELFVLQKIGTHEIETLVRPGKRFRPGKSTQITPWLSAQTVSVNESTGSRRLKLSIAHNDQRLKEYEHVPLPPYIEQNDSLASEYQTVYAGPKGSLAAPTAGLHFTPELLESLAHDHEVAKVTLHVSLGTFAKLTEENLSKGKLHSELYSIDAKTAKLLNNSRSITAVGTTSIRTLESNFRQPDGFSAKSDSTNIFIRPGYKFKAVDAVITNFHLPGTSLLMLIAAFIADKKLLSEKQAEAELMRLYNHAVKEKYKFYSFGDAMMIV